MIKGKKDNMGRAKDMGIISLKREETQRENPKEQHKAQK
jgi:hypothetical protein